jgi:hypothetical protein
MMRITVIGLGKTNRQKKRLAPLRQSNIMGSFKKRAGEPYSSIKLFII